ncbi:hypothetical protein AURDEDRAFT_163709 [Auricularia subglabra TFB-10046 SS5]|nr:hypothetical protein AURDEDRAFT_163709 [Auricularia subglabra TFB-10046 SS5]
MLTSAPKPGSLMDKLPPELLTKILESLDQADLRAAAAVSRTFYDVSWSSGLYIHHSVIWRDDPSYHYDCATLNELVQHALKKGLRLSLVFGFSSYLSGTLHDVSTSLPARELLSFLTAALPILVYLDIMVSDTFVHVLTAGLRHPAPNLTAFRLSVRTVNMDKKIIHELPVDLFMKVARNLRDLTLKNVALGHDSIAAFSHAKSVILSYETLYPITELVRHFPCMCRLDLGYWNEEDAPLPPLKLKGGSLRQLILRHCAPRFIPAYLGSTILGDIPEIEYFGRTVEWIDLLCHRKDDGPFSIRINGHDCGGIVIAIVPEHRRWRRIYSSVNWFIYAPFPVLRLPGLHDRLTHLRMDNDVIPSLLECSAMSLGALRELQIDLRSPRASRPIVAMLWPPDWLWDPDPGLPYSFGAQDKSAPEFPATSYCSIGCAVLRRLTLFAMDARMRVDSQEVAFLGRALSQCTRRAHERAALELVGIELNAPVAHALLEKTFSVVLQRDFVGGESLLGRDSGVWDEL